MPWMDSLQTASHVVQNRRDETQGPDWEKKSPDHKNGNFLFLFRRSSHVIVPRDRPSSKCPLANKIAKCGEILRLQKQWAIVILWLHTYWRHLRGENLFKDEMHAKLNTQTFIPPDNSSTSQDTICPETNINSHKCQPRLKKINKWINESIFPSQQIFHFILLALPWRIQKKSTVDMQTLVIRT